MATEITHAQADLPLIVECDESQEANHAAVADASGARRKPACAWRGASHRALPCGRRPRRPIPREYALMSQDELDQRIAAARATLGERLVILGHHYQRDEIIKFADVRGDSFKLAQFAADEARGRVHRLLRRALHGRERRHPQRAAPARHPAESGRWLLDGRYGQHRRGRGAVGGPDDLYRDEELRGGPAVRHPDHLHELRGQPEGVLRAQRRHRLHLSNARAGDAVGLRARASVCSSSPTSISAATPRSRLGIPEDADRRLEPAQGLRRPG